MKITDNVYALESTKGSYAYIILGKETILVDTGQMWQGKGILKELSAMNIKLQDIKHIVLTHHDLDHVGNAHMLQKVTNAKLWAAKEDIPYIKGYKNRPGIKRIFSFLFRVRKPENVYAYNKDIRIGDIEIIATPGHTPGHVCILYKDVLFAGDLVDSRKGQLRPYPNMNWNKDELMKSIKSISNISFKWVCPAHGIPIKRELLY
ncbi:hydrolase [Clostridium carboxidivorans P7]|uniref:Beta-lactamase domain protein n=1 Tax=Clostridium carboxidivorans P7 TaxID=536227 RepID=C6PS73_9CLOT|nr:MBL fold metallo-hydrolase [Clostridium carboxidivorans]AKN33417.1 hydrolase [Clostridium carboxidivorans P7]EET87870.1 beta-lactamase domain protein [Clostridium carboxidivorans P7]EFG89199.1 metallo-beta-lactamase domain protein [Clostridium carboxidivorans P7]